MYRKGKDIRKKRHLAAFVFPSVFGEKFPTAEFGMILAENSQMFHKDFYLPLYLPL
jgi:hypothetical protein